MKATFLRSHSWARIPAQNICPYSRNAVPQDAMGESLAFSKPFTDNTVDIQALRVTRTDLTVPSGREEGRVAHHPQLWDLEPASLRALDLVYPLGLDCHVSLCVPCT